MAAKKKPQTPAATADAKPGKLDGKDIAARATGTPEARDTARLLLEIEAISCRPDNPFIFTSGRASPVYIDCRKIISYPEARTKIMGHALKVIGKEINWSKIDVVAGGGLPDQHSHASSRTQRRRSTRPCLTVSHSTRLWGEVPLAGNTQEGTVRARRRTLKQAVGAPAY